MIRILSALLRILMLRWSGCAITAHPPIYSKHWDFAEQFTPIDAQLATIESEQAQALPHNNDENELADDSPHGLSDIWLRL